MPYDAYEGSEAEIAALASELRRVFKARLSQVVVPARLKRLLIRFATHLVNTCSHVVTFNYDDVLDRCLWDVRRLLTVGDPLIPYWHPDGGYGFFCRPASLTVEERLVFMDQTAMHLLKLHGSINWRVRRGTATIAPLDSIMHFEHWLSQEAEPGSGAPTPSQADIGLHLHPEPLWVPPVLLKSAVAEQPVLGLVWHRAFEVLRAAQQVIFVGYSFPITDIAARTLFEEALEDLPPTNITVVSLAEDTAIRERIVATYRQSFGDIPDTQFHFNGAAEWVRKSIPRG